MSAGTFDYLQFHIQEIVEMLDEYVWNYENAEVPTDIEYDLPNIKNINSKVDYALIEDMKILKDRLRRDFLWVEYMDKFLAGEIGRESYRSQLEVIRFENIDDIP